MSYTLRSTNSDGTLDEVEPTPEQALDHGAGKPILLRDERVLIDDDGRVIDRDSARPRRLDEAA